MTHSKPAALPPKPHPDFPLYAHRSGYWAKKVRGKLRYFNKWKDDWRGQKALDEWIRQKDDLLAGRTPRPKDEQGCTIRDLCNKFLSSKEVDLNIGKLSPRTFYGYTKTKDLLAETFGRERLVSDLRPDDFERLYAKLSKRHGINTIGREITMVRSYFRYGVEADLLDKAVKFGPRFKAPTKSDKRKHKARQKHKNGARTFTADEIRRMIDKAGPQLKAMIYLGINAGLGNTDCATLPLTALNLRDGWLDFPRPKSGIERRAWLWPETVAALQAVISKRREPRDPEHAVLVFLTRLGQPWVRYSIADHKDEDGKIAIKARADDAVAKATTKLLEALGIKRPGLSFYSLRRGFETIGGGCRDQVAVDAVMGHADPSMAAEYREGLPADERLKAVCNHVRDWLSPDAPK